MVEGLTLIFTTGIKVKYALKINKSLNWIVAILFH